MIGETISHYRIDSKLGEGGMGAVYKAEDLTLQRPVALKFLSAEMASDPETKKLPLKEARAASRLNHPAIATVYEVDEIEGTPFIAMELVQGESLKEILARGALPPGRLAGIARQVAEGLAEAHRAGVLHRDIKPGNVMVDGKGRVKILDFGLAVLTGRERAPGEPEETFLSRTATMWSTGGTVPYMSPEQARGEKVDERSDIFSLGVVLYECLTGRLPFYGETAVDTLHAIIRRPLTPVRSFVPEVSPGWEELVERCLAKAPAQRYGSMEEVLDAVRRAEAPATRPGKSLAVLYFENLSGDPEDEYFRDGITEDIIIELSKIQELKVFPRSAVLAYRDKPVTAPQVAQQLGASHVLGGSLRRAGKRLRITAQLVEARSGHSVWAERYDRNLEDVFAIQDEIAQNIAGGLQVMLTEKEKQAIKKAPTADIQAYDYYLRGRQFFHQLRRKSFEFARQMFARSIVIDPSYARAYAGVADCSSFLYMLWEASEENLREADAASRKALELDPDSAEAHASRGLAVSLDKRYDEARQEFETAIRLNPSLFEAHYFYARALFAQGELEGAAERFEEACRVNPEDYQAPQLLAMVYTGLGREEEAREVYRRALALTEKHLDLHPDDARALYFGAQALCALGRAEDGLQWAERALEIEPDDSAVLYNVACLHAVEGEADRAIDFLERAVECGFGQKEWMERDSDLASLRSHPRFQALLEGLGSRE